MSALISILMVIVLAVGSVFGFYNGMVSARENVDSKWSQVDNQLQRRSDLMIQMLRRFHNVLPLFTAERSFRCRL